MAAFKGINVVQPSEESARWWANTIKREKEAQKQQEQQERTDEQEQEEDQDR